MRVCVYASSSPRTSERLQREAAALGRLLGEKGFTCQNGGGKHGGMGALNRACKTAQGKCCCVIHERWVVDTAEFQQADEMIVCQGENLYDRKHKLLKGADCVIALPGGTGTFDEIWDACCQKQLGFLDVPICCVNVDGYYDGFCMQLRRAQKEELLHSLPLDQILHCEPSAAAALEWCHQQFLLKTPRDAADPATPNLPAKGAPTPDPPTDSILRVLLRMAALPPIFATYTWMFMQTIWLFMWLSGEPENPASIKQ